MFVETAIGEVPVGFAYDVCTSAHAMVGTVVEVESFRVDGLPKIYSRLLLDVEVDLRDSLPSTVTLVVPGGVIGQKTMLTSEHLPRPKKGTRWAVPLREVSARFQGSPRVGDFIPLQTQMVSASGGKLPDEAIVVAGVNAFCADWK
jgi:hypothetical protein